MKFRKRPTSGLFGALAFCEDLSKAILKITWALIPLLLIKLVPGLIVAAMLLLTVHITAMQGFIVFMVVNSVWIAILKSARK